MPLKKIGDVPRPCLSPEHKPPSHIVLEPGVYEHTCPSCGVRTTFRVERVTLGKYRYGPKQWRAE